MSDLVVRRYADRDRGAWDDLVAHSRNGTFLHQRAFLDVAGRAVQDHSLVVERGGRLVGVLAAAVHPSDPRMVDSHPTTSYGGLVHDGRLTGSSMVAALTAVAEHCYHEGFDTLRYKSIPLVYQSVVTQDDLYALFRLGGVRSRCELASLVEVGSARQVARHRLRHLRRARRAEVEITSGPQHLAAFWQVLELRLAERHGSTPQHSIDDIETLTRAFPDHVVCMVAREATRVVAGTVVFRTGRVDHAQYLAADDRGYRLSALDLVIESIGSSCRQRGVRYLGLGTTTTDGGRFLNEGLHRYKSEFGAGDVVHETYDVSLQ